jgi:hypothetical protein
VTPLAAESRLHGIARRKCCDWLSGERSLNKLGRNAVLPADAGKQLIKESSVYKKSVLGLHEITLVCLLLIKEHSIQIPWRGWWRKPRLNSEDRRKAQLWPINEI